MQYNQLTDACKPSEGKNHLMVAKFPDGEETHTGKNKAQYSTGLKYQE